ncbi:MAG: cell division protein SepF [Selenomonadales bacterium]|nr:cell division protein SepF [Selenomonadales bacterium]
MSLLQKVMSKLNIFDSSEANEIEEQEEREQEVKTVQTAPSVGKSNVVEFASAVSQKQTKVTIVEPFSFDDAQHIADHLKNRKSVVINFTNTEKEVAKRLVDFISGTTYALNGSIQEVGNQIFFCAPNNVEVSIEAIQDKFASATFMPWDRMTKDEQ